MFDACQQRDGAGRNGSNRACVNNDEEQGVEQSSGERGAQTAGCDSPAGSKDVLSLVLSYLLVKGP